MMKLDPKRRTLLRGGLMASSVGVAVSAGLLAPKALLAEWPAEAFQATNTPDALANMLGSSGTTETDKIHIKAPDIAENGAVVPVTITAELDNVSSIVLLADKNPVPLTATFELKGKAKAIISTRIKMAKTGDVVAVVKAGTTLYSARKNVKVTIGGCGG